VTVDWSEANAGRWVVRAQTPTYALRRVFQLDPAPPMLPRKVLVNDTITSTAAAVIGVHVRHLAEVVSGDVDNVQVPGRFASLALACEGGAAVHNDCKPLVCSPGVSCDLCGTEQNAGLSCGALATLPHSERRTSGSIPRPGRRWV
jgi:hypothetical protein